MSRRGWARLVSGAPGVARWVQFWNPAAATRFFFQRSECGASFLISQSALGKLRLKKDGLKSPYTFDRGAGSTSRSSTQHANKYPMRRRRVKTLVDPLQKKAAGEGAKWSQDRTIPCAALRHPNLSIRVSVAIQHCRHGGARPTLQRPGPRRSPGAHA